jgi:hypothetical protein
LTDIEYNVSRTHHRKANTRKQFIAMLDSSQEKGEGVHASFEITPPPHTQVYELKVFELAL